MNKLLTLDIVTQEKRLLTEEAKSLTIETVDGEITILPGHTPLLTRLSEGICRYLTTKDKEETVVIFGGFLEVSASGKVSILADSAVRAEDLDQAKLEQARKEAEETLKDKTKQLEFAQAEAALKRTWLELKAVNKKSRHAQN